MKPINRNHPLHALFFELVRESMRGRISAARDEDVQRYLTGLLFTFAHTDNVFAIRDRYGERLVDVADMLEEGDVLLNADSFERERQVHKHIGDFILFWSGMYPDFLKRTRLRFGGEPLLDYVYQGKESYHLVSTFDHGPFALEAPTFRKLSDEFETYSTCLSHVRRELPFDCS